MTYDPDPPSEQPQRSSSRILKLIAKIIVGIFVLFVVAVALVFGVCWLGSGNG